MQQKLANSLFGAESAQDLNNIVLVNEKDFINFAKIVNMKIKGAKSRNFQISFINELLRELDSSFRPEDYHAIQQTVTSCYNKKLKDSKGKEKKKSKGELTSPERGRGEEHNHLRRPQGLRGLRGGGGQGVRTRPGLRPALRLKCGFYLRGGGGDDL